MADGSVRLAIPVHLHAKEAGGKRILSGIASTSSVDRMGDILEPLGATWALPMPLLLGHSHDKPIGVIRKLEASASSIRLVSEVARGIGVADEAWAQIQAGLCGSLSVGFIGRKGEPIATGTRWLAWEIVEVSCVAVPANPEAKIEAAIGKSLPHALNAQAPSDPEGLGRELGKIVKQAIALRMAPALARIEALERRNG